MPTCHLKHFPLPVLGFHTQTRVSTYARTSWSGFGPIHRRKGIGENHETALEPELIRGSPTDLAARTDAIPRPADDVAATPSHRRRRLRGVEGAPITVP